MRRQSILTSRKQPASMYRRAFLLILGIIFLSTAWTVSPGAEVGDLIINHSQGHLLLSLKIRDVVTREAKEPVKDELSSTIVFSIALNQVSPFWFDKSVVHQTAANTLRYDPSTKEYILFRSWDSGAPMVVGSLDAALKLMTEVKDLRVVPLAQLEKNKNYQIRIQAVCQDQNVFIFGPSGYFKTDWYTVDFTF